MVTGGVNTTIRERLKQNDPSTKEILGYQKVKNDQGQPLVVNNKYVFKAINLKGLGIQGNDYENLTQPFSINNNTYTVKTELPNSAIISYYINNKPESAFIEIPKQLSPVLELSDNIETINIYAGTNENAELSNFAVRPFKFWVGDKIRLFKTVEGAFQASKLGSTNSFLKTKKLTEDQIKTLEFLQKASGAEAKSTGKGIKDLNTDVWNKVSSERMKPLLLESFKQNPKDLQKLLNTGKGLLTHTQDKTKWGLEFPRLLMEVRFELSNQSENEFPNLDIKIQDNC